MRNIGKESVALFVSVIFFVLLFLAPLLLNLSDFSRTSVLLSESTGFRTTVIRTVSFALFSSLLNVFFAYFGALSLSKIDLFTKKGTLLSLLLLPVLLGNLTIAFMAKAILTETGFIDYIVRKGAIYQFIFLLMLQGWQYGTLYLYVFWLRLQTIPLTLKSYAASIKLPKLNYFRDITLPHTRNLVVLLILINFVFAFYEDAKNQYLFKASQGTNAELLNRWLNRTYQSDLAISANFAINQILVISLIVTILAAVCFCLLAPLFILILNIYNNIPRGLKIFKYCFVESVIKKNINPAFLVPVFILPVIVPVLILILKSNFIFSNDLLALKFPLFITSIAALFSVALAVLLSISSRLVFLNLLKDFNFRSTIYFVGLFILQLIPPIALLICGYKWSSILNETSVFFKYTIWILGHSILSLSLLTGFLTTVHFGLLNSELFYQRTHLLKLREIIKISFLKRFKLEYLLTLIFAFSLIWNESIINRIMSDFIPSFSSRLEMLITGRAADYSQAFGYLIVSLSVSFISVILWVSFIEKARRK